MSSPATGHPGPRANRTAGFPGWLVNVDATLPVTAQFVLHGNLRDLVILPPATSPTAPPPGAQPMPRILPLEAALTHTLQLSGYQFVLWHRPHELRVLPDTPQARQAAAACLGVAVDRLPQDVAVQNLLGVLNAVVGHRQGHAALVLDYVSQWRPTGEPPSPEEHELLQGALVALHRANSFPHPSSPRPAALHNPVFWLVDRPADLPGWLVSGSDNLRQIPIPLPDLDTRTIAARALLPALAVRSGQPEDPSAVRAFADATESMTIGSMFDVVQLSLDRDLPPSRIDDAVRAFRMGLLENPWAKPELRDRIRHGEKELGERVRGQERAIRHALDILIRSSTGMTSAQTGGHNTGPRGILFLAGPTGVGKTELAKAITSLVFGDERAYVRLDMSEYTSEHSEARMIGSPPGFVGHGAGGELTNAVRQRPFCLVLFDEIEKAHPRILDKFLQILSDGRLTDGSGSTVHFSESLIVFTSNLGVPQLEPDQEPPRGEELVSQVTEAISDEFTHTLNRPELLGRIGDNIVVFDYITPQTARDLANRFVDNACARALTQTGIRVRLTDAVRGSIVAAATADLSKGGRGISLAVESGFVNPLARALFPLAGPTEVTATDVVKCGGGWTELVLT